MQNFDAKTRPDINARCYEFSLRIIALIDSLPNKRSSWVIGDQLTRSATSIGANLAEAKGSGSRLEFKRYNEIALKSAHETCYWLSLLRGAGLARPDAVEPLLGEAGELVSMLASGVIKLKKSMVKGE